MRYLVTGGGGLIGANLALALAKQGHEVHALDHFLVGTRNNLDGFSGSIYPRDIRDFDFDPLGHFDGIFHQAAITDTTILDEALMRAVNVEAFARILEFALRSGCPKVVFASSAARMTSVPLIFSLMRSASSKHSCARENCPMS